jgi:peroxiredoxin
MNETAAKPNSEYPKLALASLALGAMGLALSNFLLGGVLGIVGLVLGIFQIGLNSKGKMLAWTGVALSAVALVVGARSATMNLLPNPFTNWIGVQAPEFSGQTLDGGQVRLSDFKGKRVILNFWSTTCPPCIAEVPDLNKLHQVASNEVVILGITSDAPAVLKKFIQRNNVGYAIVNSFGLPVPYKQVQMIPTTFFIDRKGVIQNATLGRLTFQEFQKAALGPDFEGPVKPAPATATSPQ